MSSNNNKEVSINELTEEEKKLYLSEKLSKYKITFTVCIMYGIIALIILIIGLFTPWGNKYLLNDLAAFFITYIIGTIVIIIFLSNEIYNYKPTKGDIKMGYDAEMCPDYWRLDLDKNQPTYYSNDLNKLHFKYKCVLDENLFQKQKFKELDDSKPTAAKKGYQYGLNNRLYVELNKTKSGITGDNEFNEFKTYAANMSGYTYNKKNDTLNSGNNSEALKPNTGSFNNAKIPLACDTVYPVYLSVMDNENAKNNLSEPKNRYRCAYAKACGVSWTEAGCP